uniref:Uncharacterized protein n=1 Tax=Oryza meridionalis TaxID=40149 RepID=A0A0E0C085_9ORYZ
MGRNTCITKQCKKEKGLGMGSVLQSSTHHMFDGILALIVKWNRCPFEVYKEDIMLAMKEEKVFRDEALRLLLEEWMDVWRKMEDKRNRVLEKLEDIEAHRGKASEETMVTTTDLKAASSNTQDIAAYDANQVSMASFNDGCTRMTASSSHTNEVPSPMAALELGYCSMAALNVNGGTNRAVVAFLTMTGMSKVVPTSVESMDIFSARSTIDLKENIPMLTMQVS